MKKIFTLLAATAMVLTASAQTAETWKPDGTEPENKTVNLPSMIKCRRWRMGFFKK